MIPEGHSHVFEPIRGAGMPLDGRGRPQRAPAGRHVNRPDPLLMLADIARLAAERPELDVTSSVAIYQHLRGLRPAPSRRFAGLLEYMGHLISPLGDATSRATLGLAPRVAGGRRNACPGRRADPPARRGRPRGSGLLTVANGAGGLPGDPIRAGPQGDPGGAGRDWRSPSARSRASSSATSWSWPLGE